MLALAIVAACAAAPAETALAQQVPQSREQIALSFAPIVRKASPAVVNIFTTKQGAASPLDSLFSDPFFDLFFEGQRRAPRGPSQQSLGSGVIVREDGLIVTNHHVIEDAEQIMVVLSDRREYQAEILGDDETGISPCCASMPAMNACRPSRSAIPTGSRSAIWCLPSATRSASG
jgi:serine protease Do